MYLSLAEPGTSSCSSPRPGATANFCNSPSRERKRISTAVITARPTPARRARDNVPVAYGREYNLRYEAPNRASTAPVVDTYLKLATSTNSRTSRRRTSKDREHRGHRKSSPQSQIPDKQKAAIDSQLFWWGMLDSNQRSRRQQIYSLLPWPLGKPLSFEL